MPKLVWPLRAVQRQMGIWGVSKDFPTVGDAEAWARGTDAEREGMLLVSGSLVYLPTAEGFAAARQFEGPSGPTGPTGPPPPQPEQPRRPHLDGTW